MALIDDFKARFPDIPTETVDKYLPLNEDITVCYYDAEYGSSTCTDEIILQLLAHLITIDSKTGSSSLHDVSSKAVDGVSISFTAANLSTRTDDFFNSTKYGQRYLQLIRFDFGARFV